MILINRYESSSEQSSSCSYVVVKRLSTTWVTSSSTIQSNIINDKVVVEPGYYKYYSLDFAEQTTLKGYFTTVGGSGDDIIVALLDDIGFTNYVKDHSFRSYYYSGKITTDRFTVTLPPGKYYLVLDNRFSVFSNKVVNLQLTGEMLHETVYPVEQITIQTEYRCP